MFGRRSDGRKLKGADPYFKLIPLIMKRRSDSQVFYTQDIPLAPLDEYIAKKDAEGIKLSYMDIIFAAIVRLLAEKPTFNRFVVNGRIYARNDISISLAIKKGMSETAEETILKLHFKGTENVFEIRDKLENLIIENKNVSAENSTDRIAKALAYIPHWLMKFAVNTLIFMDQKGILPKSVIEASPFHTSAFLTNVGSIGLDSIYHHIYDFGTTSIFLAMGKKKKSFIYEDEAGLKEERSISLSWVADERICDGYNYATGIKTFYRYLRKPELLENHAQPVKDLD